MVELQSVTHMCGLGHNLCHQIRSVTDRGSEMELLVFLKLSAPEKDCSFVNLPDGSLLDIARLLQTIKYKLYLR